MNSCLKGRIEPVNWDSSGRPVRYSICPEEGEEVVLNNSRFDGKFSRLTGKWLEVEGRLIPDKYGGKTLTPVRVRRIKKDAKWYQGEAVEEFPVWLPPALQNALLQTGGL